MTAAGHRPVLDRLVLGFLMLLMAIGCLALWTVVPGGALWLVSLAKGSAATHLVLALFAVPTAIVLFGAALVRVNALYVRVAAASADDDERGEFTRGPLEWLIVASLAIAVVAMVAWMIFVAKDPFPWTTPAP